MSSRKTVILIAAIGFGVLAAFTLWQYTNGLEDDVYADSERIPVWVARRDIPANTPGDAAIAAFLEEKFIPREFVPASIIQSTDVIRGKVALGEIKANEFILEGNFVNPSLAQTSFTQRIPDGLVAVPLGLSQEQTGGFLQPGDSVLLVVQQDIAAAEFASSVCLEFGADSEERQQAYQSVNDSLNPDAELECDKNFFLDGGGGETTISPDDTGGDLTEDVGDEAGPDVPKSVYNTVTRPFYWEAQVLAIGAQTALAPGEVAVIEDEAGGATVTTGNITFAVPPEAMFRLLSIDQSLIRVIMVPDNFEPTVLEQMSIEELIDPLALFPAEDESRLTPYGPEGYIAGDPALGDIAFADEDDESEDADSTEDADAAPEAPTGPDQSGSAAEGGN